MDFSKNWRRALDFWISLWPIKGSPARLWESVLPNAGSTKSQEKKFDWLSVGHVYFWIDQLLHITDHLVHTQLQRPLSLVWNLWPSDIVTFGLQNRNTWTGKRWNDSILKILNYILMNWLFRLPNFSTTIESTAWWGKKRTNFVLVLFKLP